MVKYSKKVFRSGTGLVVRVPKDIIEFLNLKENSLVEVDIKKVRKED